ncbi:hypothetical protein THRCLA_08520 [Thraustotheca clavata]|uniref:Uncharacterized protein n=1 Tax=Thraustotheca clavata TaxID=74557 RepID=A0A1V9Z5J9_9STRA|nr:hypothetical protein THRCLA_08520 [Thraustotheca clavata]
MSVVPTLYRALLRVAKGFYLNEQAGRSIYAGVRSGGLIPYAGVQTDWKNEQSFRMHLDALGPRDVQKMEWKDVVAATRLKFTAESRLNRNERIDRGFLALKNLGNHNALVRTCLENGAFDPKYRPPGLLYRVGDVVDVQGLGKGVICSWYFPKLKYAKERKLKVKYMVLLHTDKTAPEDRWKLYRVHQERIHLAEIPAPISNPSLIFYFDGFEDGRHVPSAALAQRFPEDVKPTPASILPTIMQLQNADEEELTKYLTSPDKTIVNFTKVALEAIWSNEAGENAKQELESALDQLESSEAAAEGISAIEKLVQAHPDWAHALEKLAMAHLAEENFKDAHRLFQRVLDLKPNHFRALSGLATCAVRLRDWNLAHDTASKLIRISPESAIALKVLAKVDEALYHLL